MGMKKYTGVDNAAKTEVISGDERAAISSHLSKVGKASLSELTDEERKALNTQQNQ